MRFRSAAAKPPLWKPAAMLPAVIAAACAAALQIPSDWQSVAKAPRIEHVQLDERRGITTALRPLRDKGVRVVDNKLMRGDKTLTEAFRAIDSFDVSESRGEVVFSARRERGDYDIGLVSLDGSPISWVPAERVDEVGVQWAPRGNKISYIVRGNGGDFIRTVHIPTAAQLGIDFPAAKIHDLGWDPKGELFAVAYSTPDASDRVEVMHYQGKERRIAYKPMMHLDVTVESFGPDAVSLRPNDLTYGEKLPLVVSIDDEPFAWSDARAELMGKSRVAVVVTKRALSEAFWKMAGETPWFDMTRVFVVGGGLASVPAGAIRITPEASLPVGHYRRRGTIVAVSPAVVQSFAARFIANELKRTSPTNGSSR